MFRPRRPAMSVPAFSSSELCVSAFGSLPCFCSGGSSDPFPRSFAPVPSLPALSPATPVRTRRIRRKPFLFIDLLHNSRTPRGWGPRRLQPARPTPFLFFPHRVNIQRTGTPATPIVSCEYSRFSGCPGGWGRNHHSWLSPSKLLGLRPTGHGPRNTGHVFSARLCELCASALSFSPLFLSTFNCRLSTFLLPQNFYPPASDLRHNPAAQGHHPQSNLRAGRIQ